ncbi:CBS domain-containing protein [Thiospirochaeta perfilievii]|uniref:CBS domain-containing protein n=1 Tax=Thiospirochaeta perfilievii TaxID=252967 RepID=A0A5C1QAL9_9SPIO|nr:cation:proton antiporter [Thiospirochaeta perfilievii]QEN03969.1 CBS domain-containing protein [Thiospirochaeta perfilievii]
MKFFDIFTENVDFSSFNMILLLGVILFGGTLVGRLFQKWKIPQVVGYIGLGLVLGQTGFNLINSKTLTNLQPFSTFALGLIGFMIGGELKLKTIKKYGKQFLTILLMESLGAFFIVFILISITSYLFFHDIKIAISLGLLLGAISSATAPAATTDVLWENKTRGPLTTMILGIVAMDDAVSLLLFAIASSVVGILSGQAGANLGLSILALIWEIGLSVFLGVGIGALLFWIIKNFVDEDKILAFSIGAILLLIGLAQVLGVDVILSTMAMGFFISNFAPRRSEETFHLVEKFTPPVYILFFVMVGATLNVGGLTKVTVVMALVYLFGRMGGKAAGSILGAIISKAPTSVRKYLPFCLFSQAGVAIGLSIVAGNTFDGVIGETIVLIITATTFVVQLIGPTAVKFAVSRSGEVGLNITAQDLIRQSRGRDLADKNIPLIKENENLNNILSIFASRDNLYYPVVNSDNKLVGILSIENLKDTFIASELSDFLLAHDIMDSILYTTTLDSQASDIYSLFDKSHVPSIPVVDKDGRVEGMIENRRMQQFISRRLVELKKKAEDMETL